MYLFTASRIEMVRINLGLMQHTASQWMASNRLKLNPNKTEFFRSATTRRQHFKDVQQIYFARTDSFPVDSLKLLTVHIDSQLQLTTQVGKVVPSCFYQLQQMKSVRKSLTVHAAKSAKSMINAFDVSRINYCNGLLTGQLFYQFETLQKVLNGATRLLCDAPRYLHITTLLATSYIGRLW